MAETTIPVGDNQDDVADEVKKKLWSKGKSKKRTDRRDVLKTSIQALQKAAEKISLFFFAIYWHNNIILLVLIPAFIVTLFIVDIHNLHGLPAIIFNALLYLNVGVIFIQTLVKIDILKGDKIFPFAALESNRVREGVDKELAKFHAFYRDQLNIVHDCDPVRDRELSQVIHDYHNSKQSSFNQVLRTLFSSSFIAALVGWESLKNLVISLGKILPSEIALRIIFIILVVLMTIIMVLVLSVSLSSSLHTRKAAEQLILRRQQS